MKTKNDRGSIGIFVILTDGKCLDGKVLLVKNNNGKWSLPGGGLERGELVDAAAAREVEEETGFDIEIKRQVGIFSLRKELGIVILFEGKIKAGELKADSDEEISERRYFSFKEIKDLADKEKIYPAQLGLIGHAAKINMDELFLEESICPIYDFLIPPVPVA